MQNNIIKQATELLNTPSFLIEKFTTLNLKPVKLEDYQKNIIDSNNLFHVINKSRRLGFSTVIGALRGLINCHRFENYTCYFISYNLEEAKERIRIAKMAYVDMPEKYNGKLVQKKLKTDSKTSLEFYDWNNKSVSRLVSIPCRELRGGEGDVIMDELAFYREAQSIYVSSVPVISVGGQQYGGYKLIIASTPRGRKGLFHELSTDINKNKQFIRYNIPFWHSHQLCVNVEEAKELAPYMTTEERVMVYGTPIIQMIFEQMYLEDFQQEFECSFNDETLSFLTFDMIKACMPDGSSKAIEDGDDGILENPTIFDFVTNKAEVPQFSSIDELILKYNPEIHGVLYGGMDVGRKNHASEISIIGHINNYFISWASITLLKMPFEQQKDIVKKLLKSGIIKSFMIDETGLGMDMAETFSLKFPRIVESVNFTAPVKEKLANDLYLVFERKEILLGNDRELFNQLFSIKRTITLAKYAKFDVDNSETKAHGDKFWALALAYQTTHPKPNEYPISYYEKELQAMGISDTLDLPVDNNIPVYKDEYLDNIRDYYSK